MCICTVGGTRSYSNDILTTRKTVKGMSLQPHKHGDGQGVPDSRSNLSGGGCDRQEGRGGVPLSYTAPNISDRLSTTLMASTFCNAVRF